MSEHEELLAKARAQQLDFLKVEIETGLTFASLAVTKMQYGQTAHARHNLEVAGTAYRTILEKLPELELSGEERSEIDSGLQRMREALDSVPKDE